MSDRCVTHDWRPVPGEWMQYCCLACAASGYRGAGGVIRLHRDQKKYDKPTDVHIHHAAYAPTGRRVKPKPRSR